MPRDTLRWRLDRWLAAGSAAVDVGAIRTPTLVVYGDADATLPSAQEAATIAETLETNAVRVRTVSVPGAGHAATLGSRIDLRAAVADFFGELDEFGFLAADVARAMRADAAGDPAGPLYGLFPRTYPPVGVQDYFSAALDARAGAGRGGSAVGRF